MASVIIIQRQYFYTKVKKEVGNVTIVINNAGVMKISPFLDTSETDVESMFSVNILSHIWVFVT